MKLVFSEVEREILARTAKGPMDQAKLVTALMPMGGSNYTYMKIRALAACGHIEKEKRGNRTTLYITPPGRRALAMMESAGEGV